MRVIAGLAKGRRLVTPPGHTTRPFTDRMRESLFAALGDRVEGAEVLDLFAGSGAVGLEALSRGAARVRFVESDRRAVTALRQNIEAVGLGGDVVATTVERHLTGDRDRYDLVFVDPPYPMPDEEVAAIAAATADRLHEGGLVVVHRRKGSAAPESGMLSVAWHRRYGDAEVWWLHKELDT